MAGANANYRDIEKTRQRNIDTRAVAELRAVPGDNAALAGKEFAVRCPRPAEEIVAALAAEGILAGYPLGRDYPELGDCLLIAVTEQRTKEEIDRLTEALTAG